MMAGIQHSKFNIQHSLPPLLTFVIAVGSWEALVRGFGIPLYLLPAPSQVVATFLERPGYLLGIGMATFGNALVGCLIGCALGCLVADACVQSFLKAGSLVLWAVAASA
ncbi:MAG: hypothetical protein WCI67_20160, partial [Chloroflexales bacterium]